MEQRVLPNLSRAMISVLVGKQASNLINLERQLQASISIDYRFETLTVWALPRDMEAAVHQIEAMCEAHRSVAALQYTVSSSCVCTSLADPMSDEQSWWRLHLVLQPLVVFLCFVLHLK